MYAPQLNGIVFANYFRDDFYLALKTLGANTSIIFYLVYVFM